jgi:uncharacterized protein YheU (UPF0270 family)
VAHNAKHIAIAHDELDPATLLSVVQDLVTRDGTDYGAVEKTLDQKAAALMRELDRGEAKLVFDAETESIGLMTAADFERASAASAASDSDE